MPYIKQISIHKSPKHFLRYILRGDKNSDMKYASGVSITADLDYAYDEFRDIYEAFSGKRFHDESKHTGNERVRLHHYIQSFDPKDNITPETAHDIGREWAWENFGGERQVIISTHIDKGHIHNHFAVAPYDLNGKCWYSNRSTLRTLRNSSDEIYNAWQNQQTALKSPVAPAPFVSSTLNYGNTWVVDTTINGLLIGGLSQYN